MAIFVQSILIFLFLYNSEFLIPSLRIEYLDIALNNHFFNLIFVTFCLMIFWLTCTNFIDGLNGLVLSYYLIVSLIIFKTGLIEFSLYDNFEISILIISIILLILFNFLNQLYLGDSGSYLLGFSLVTFLLFYENNQLFSPYFVSVLLWYPAFEILFSI